MGRIPTPSIRGPGAALLTAPTDPDTKKRLEAAESIRRMDAEIDKRNLEARAAARLEFMQGAGGTEERSVRVVKKILGFSKPNSKYPARYPNAELLLMEYTDLRRSHDAAGAAEVLRERYSAASADAVKAALARAKAKVKGWVTQYPHLSDFHQQVLDRLPSLPHRTAV